MKRPRSFSRLLLVAFISVALLQTTSIAQQDSNAPGKLRIIFFGAHPDDAELDAGGTSALWAKQGHEVKFVSLTNGDIGHAQMAGGELAKRRLAEVQRADKILGVEAEVLDIHDGELMPTLENRQKIVEQIREWKADIVISHRPNDYHPDHRYTGILVQDAAFMVIVKHFLPTVPHLPRNPVFLYSEDGFQKPQPFDPDIIVPIDEVMDQKLDALWELESQIESLWATGDFEEVVPVPKEGQAREERRKAVEDRFRRRYASIADRFRDKLVEQYGEAGRRVQYAEAFELCEYGRRPNPEELQTLAPKINLAPSR